MKLRLAFVLLTILMSAYVVPISAQEAGDGRTVEELRAELSNAHDRVADLKIRLEQLNFDLKPENIERHFNGFGSTRPEELRESRRRQLQTEKDRAVAQLEQLEASCTRLEAAINTAQASAYQQSMTIVVGRAENRDRYFFVLTRVMIPIAVLCAFLVAITFGFLIRRRRNL